MNCSYRNILYLSFLSLVCFTGCKLEENPIVNPDKDAIFSSEEGIEAYSESFYDGLPTAVNQANMEQSLIDYGAPRSLNTFHLRNAYNEDNASGWSWTVLRNINYFIANNTDPLVPEEVRNNYNGLARFFRAWFYFDKVKRFGDVPWVDHPLDIEEDSLLFGERDSRQLVMENVYKDLEYAGENVSRENDATQCSLITKWAVYAFASRVALFEGTFRKYHQLDLETTPEEWLERAVEMSKLVMDNSGKSLNPDYGALFKSLDPPHSETILAIASDPTLDVKTSINWDWTSETKGSAMNLIRPFLNTFLQKDGTPYTQRPGWQYEDFYEEFQDRDNRLKEAVRYPGYERNNQLTLPSLGGFARIGYQPRKLIDDDNTNADDKGESVQAVQLIRYAEVLLNYAEAKAELHELSDNDWNLTIGALRERAGITGGLTQRPQAIDEYFQGEYFPQINDPVILEVRRERGIELLLEGFRFDDIRRWNAGYLMKKPWTGMYISGINKPLDIDHDGIDDVIYYDSNEGRQDALNNSNNSDIITVEVSSDSNGDGIQLVEAGNNQGFYLGWLTNKEDLKVWGPKQYLYPIPIGALNLNSSLSQNPGWENGATNDGN